MKWCEHIEITKNHVQIGNVGIENSHDDNWKFCPICGTPRPKEKSLEEKFIEFDKALADKQHSRLDAVDSRDYFKTLAKIAEEFYGYSSQT